jgi:hypothetical protein
MALFLSLWRRHFENLFIQLYCRYRLFKNQSPTEHEFDGNGLGGCQVFGLALSLA